MLLVCNKKLYLSKITGSKSTLLLKASNVNK